MKIRIHHPLFAGFIGVVCLLVVLVVALVGTRLRDQLLELRRDDLRRTLALVAMEVEAVRNVDPDSLMYDITRRIGFRLTLIDPSGVVLGDSDVARPRLDALENHASRPEVRGALAGDLSFAVRESATLGRPLLYAAEVVDFRGRPAVLRVAASLDEVDRTVRRAQVAVAVAGLLGMVLALGVAYLLSRAFARPLVTLADRAQSLAAGDLTARAPRGSRVAELDELALAFNRLADELEARLGELSRERDEMGALIDCMAEGVVALTDDARLLRTNRAAAELLGLPPGAVFAPVGALVRQPELRDILEAAVVRPFRARELTLRERHVMATSRLLDGGGAVVTFLDVTEIRRLEQVRRDFVANASHEMKTPLTTMRGWAETLLEDDPPDQLRRQFLSSIRDNALRLQRLVDDLLDLSRLESGGWVARREEVDPARVARDVWVEFEARAREREIAFEVEAEEALRAVADERGLSQIYRNLFDNAVRHTADGGRVRVELRRAGSEVVVSVEDTGSGIPSSALPRIFERFYRADPARSRAEGGTGLGLAIVRHLVSAMGGEVAAESRLGHGTTIRFTLPLAATGSPTQA